MQNSQILKTKKLAKAATHSLIFLHLLVKKKPVLLKRKKNLKIKEFQSQSTQSLFQMKWEQFILETKSKMLVEMMYLTKRSSLCHRKKKIHKLQKLMISAQDKSPSLETDHMACVEPRLYMVKLQLVVTTSFSNNNQNKSIKIFNNQMDLNSIQNHINLKLTK